MLFNLSLISVLLTYSFSYAGVIEAAKPWKKNSLSVCWALTSEIADLSQLLTGTQRQMAGDNLETNEHRSYLLQLIPSIQSIIQSEYTLEDTGIEFIGWNHCTFSSDSNKIDVTLVLASSKKGLCCGTSEAGEASAIGMSERTAAVLINILPDLNLRHVVSSELAVKMISVHEFGHIAGLLHEQAHPDYAKDNYGQLDPDSGWAGSLLSSRYFSLQPEVTSAFDPNSIMLYNFSSIIRGWLSDNFEKRGSNFYIDGKKLTPKKHKEIEAFRILDSRLFIKDIMDNDRIKYQYHPGLSKGDRHALKCIYIYDPVTRERDCQRSFSLY